jgi:hypothetical protein
MNPAELELALKKQRLQLASAQLRDGFSRHATGLAPVFSAADRVVAGVRWLQLHPQILVAAAVTLIVARPRKVWRLARRSYFVWQAWNKLSQIIDRSRPV